MILNHTKILAAHSVEGTTIKTFNSSIIRFIDSRVSRKIYSKYDFNLFYMFIYTH